MHAFTRVSRLPRGGRMAFNARPATACALCPSLAPSTPQPAIPPLRLVLVATHVDHLSFAAKHSAVVANDSAEITHRRWNTRCVGDFNFCTRTRARARMQILSAAPLRRSLTHRGEGAVRRGIIFARWMRGRMERNGILVYVPRKLHRFAARESETSC